MQDRHLALLSSVKTDEPGLIRFCLELNEDISFFPGQYGRVTILEPEYNDERGNSRSFTIASRGDSNRSLCFMTRRGISAFKRTLIISRPGTRLKFLGPFGKFIERDLENPSVFICGGIGIVPVISFLKRVLEAHAESRAVIFHITNHESDPVLAGKVLDLISRGVHAEYHRILPRGKLKRPGKLTFERIMEYADQDMLKDAIFYISGPAHIINHVEPVLSENGISEDRIRVEVFPGY